MGIRITPEMMGGAMGVPAQTIRVGIQQGVFNFGVILKKDPEQFRCNYIIIPELARQALGDERYNDMIAKAAAESKAEYKPLKAI